MYTGLIEKMDHDVCLRALGLARSINYRTIWLCVQYYSYIPGNAIYWDMQCRVRAFSPEMGYLNLLSPLDCSRV